MPSFNQVADQGQFVPTTDVFDTQVIYSLDINSQEFKEFLVRLRQNINNIALALNRKDLGSYVQEEIINGQLYFPIVSATAGSTNDEIPFRQVFRKVVEFGALPNTASKPVAHGIANITSSFTFTRIYATASDTAALTYRPIPSANIDMVVDATNVTITTVSNLSSFGTTHVVLEYLKE